MGYYFLDEIMFKQWNSFSFYAKYLIVIILLLTTLMIVFPVIFGIIIGSTGAILIYNISSIFLSVVIALMTRDSKPYFFFSLLLFTAILFHLKNQFELIEVSNSLNLPYDSSLKHQLTMIFFLFFHMSIWGTITMLLIKKINQK